MAQDSTSLSVVNTAFRHKNRSSRADFSLRKVSMMKSLRLSVLREQSPVNLNRCTRYTGDFHCFEPDMKLIRGIHNLSKAPHGCVLTIGNFDGVHRGHQALLQDCVKKGRRVACPLW
jgi:hypothetical protein